MNTTHNTSPKLSNKPAPDGGLLREPDTTKPFGKVNFILMAICLGLIIIGFMLMSGPGSSVEEGFNPDIFSTRRIVVGPTLSFLGFLFMAFAILYRPGKLKLSKRHGNDKDNTKL